MEISKCNMLSSASPLKSRWPPPLFITVDRRLPHIKSPLLMSPPLVLIQQRCVDFCPDRPRSPSHDHSRTRDACSSHHRFSRRSHERYDQRVAYSDAPAHRRRPRYRESPPSRHLDFTSKSLSHLRGASPHGGPRRLRRGASPHVAPSRLLRSASHHGGCRRLLRRASPHGGPRRLLRGASPHSGPRRLLRGASHHGGPRHLLRGESPHGGPHRLLRGSLPTQRHVASKGSPPPKRMGLAPVAGPSFSRRPLYRDFRSPRRSSRDFLSPQRGSPSSKRRRNEARDSVSPQQLHSSAPLISSFVSRALSRAL